MTKTPQHLADTELATLTWTKSQQSATGGAGDQCVEVGRFNDGTGRVGIRHSHWPDRALLVFTREEWTAFRRGMQAGEFDF